MTNADYSPFRLNWVLVNELAIGPAPRTESHLDRLHDSGVRAVLSLCGTNEAEPPPSLQQRFICRRLVLPDHRFNRTLELKELQSALTLLEDLQSKGPVFVHCVAALERSPLVCMAWLVEHKQLSPTDALDYLMQVHPGTNPLPQQLAILRELTIQSKSSEEQIAP